MTANFRKWVLWALWKSYCSREDAASPALQEKINYFGLERFKDFLPNPTFHQRKQYKIPCLNYWWLFPYIGQQKGFCYQGKWLPCHCFSSLKLIIGLLLKLQHSFLISAASFHVRYFFCWCALFKIALKYLQACHSDGNELSGTATCSLPG